MKITDKTYFRFIIVGIINTIIGSGTMFILYNVFNTGYWISTASNYIIGSIVSYVLNKYYTFQNKEKSKAEMVRFIFNICVCYFIAYGVTKPLVYKVMESYSKSIQDNITMLIGMGVFVCLNYIGQRFFVFKNK